MLLDPDIFFALFLLQGILDLISVATPSCFAWFVCFFFKMGWGPLCPDGDKKKKKKKEKKSSEMDKDKDKDKDHRKGNQDQAKHQSGRRVCTQGSIYRKFHGRHDDPVH